MVKKNILLLYIAEIDFDTFECFRRNVIMKLVRSLIALLTCVF